MQGFTTSLPTPSQLAELINSKFRHSSKDYSGYLAVLTRLLPPGARILDFGCSWGYGSRQIKNAGYDVYSYEIGELRARYAKEQLDCNMVHNLRTLDGTVDCLFSAHVIEHLPDPAILLLEARKVLVPGGYFVCCCPNGNPARQDKDYDTVWGKVHPLFITPDFMRWAFERYGLTLYEVAAGENMVGEELLAIARLSSK